jgi:protein CrcB
MGTFLVNVSGAFVVGFLFPFLTDRFTIAPWLRSALLIGFLGAYTTFSTLSFETFRLLEDRATRWLPRTGWAASASDWPPSTSGSSSGG